MCVRLPRGTRGQASVAGHQQDMTLMYPALSLKKCPSAFDLPLCPSLPVCMCI